MAKKEKTEAAPDTKANGTPAHDLVTAAQAGELIGKSPGYMAGRAKRGATLPQEAARVGRSVFYEKQDVLDWWETAQHEKVSRGRRSNLPEGVKSRASVMLLDDEWEAFQNAKGDQTTVDFVRAAVLAAIT
jgi:hypothetical protein